MATIMITSEPLHQKPGKHVELLRNEGFDVGFPELPVLISEYETVEALQEARAVIAGSEPYTASVLSQLPELRVIARCGVGYDRVDVDAATRHGVVLAIAPGGNYEAVAEHTFALLLAVARQVVRIDRDVHRGLWPKPPLIPLRGQTLGVVGLGRIGRAMADRALSFRMNVIAHDPYAEDSWGAVWDRADRPAHAACAIRLRDAALADESRNRGFDQSRIDRRHETRSNPH